MKQSMTLLLIYLYLVLPGTRVFSQSSPMVADTTDIKNSQYTFPVPVQNPPSEEISILIDAIDNPGIQMIEEKPESFWLLFGTNLYHYNDNLLKEYPFDFASGTSSYFIRIFMSGSGTLWVARTIEYVDDNTKGAVTLHQFNKETEKFETYYIPIDKAIKNFPNISFSRWHIISLSEDKTGNIWIVLNTGIYLFNPKSGDFTHLPLPLAKENSKSQPYIQAFETRDNGKMWIGTNVGLYLYHAGKFTHYQHNPGDSTSLRNDNIGRLYEDSSGTLWIRTNSGESVLRPDTLGFKLAPESRYVPYEVGWNFSNGKEIFTESNINIFEGEIKKIKAAEGRVEVPGEWVHEGEVYRLESSIRELILTWLSVPITFLLILSIVFYRYRLKQVRLKSNFDKQLAEVSMMALRAQMNPHFLFNSLNSINHFIVKNKPEEAAEYLTKFSRLIRLILTNSKLTAVPLANEIEAVRLYLQLEKIRFNNRFDYSIEVEEGVDVDYFEIPPLLIQPYIENAIWHGLLHKEEKGHLKLLLYVQDPYLFVIVEDNGVGRRKAQEQKSKSATKDKSMGMQITAERVDLLNQLKQQQATVEIIDMEDQDGNPSGTKVIMRIPI